eukprot:Hpha_TRINITY_DN21206_c0_g1::TRINITY_DN21206_c0_g1_i1::g.171574::m.171574
MAGLLLFLRDADKRIPIEVDPNATVGELLQEAGVGNRRVFFQGSCLDPKSHLADTGVSAEAELQLSSVEPDEDNVQVVRVSGLVTRAHLNGEYERREKADFKILYQRTTEDQDVDICGVLYLAKGESYWKLGRSTAGWFPSSKILLGQWVRADKGVGDAFKPEDPYPLVEPLEW